VRPDGNGHSLLYHPGLDGREAVLIATIVVAALCAVLLVAIPLACYPLAKLALQHVKDREAADAVADMVEPDIAAQGAFVAGLKERYATKLAPSSEFRTVGKFTEITWEGNTYRAPKGEEEWRHQWAEYPSGMARHGAANRIVELWEAERRRKDWAS
jgi:hypothetical protein